MKKIKKGPGLLAYIEGGKAVSYSPSKEAGKLSLKEIEKLLRDTWFDRIPSKEEKVYPVLSINECIEILEELWV